MKNKIIFLFIFITIFCLTCTKKTTENESILINDNESEPSINSTFYVIPANGINLRSEPSINGEKKSLLSQNTKLIVLERSHNIETIDGLENYWYKVETMNELGWVFGGYLSERPTTVINEFHNYIRLTNCTITTDYYVPIINNIIGGDDDYFFINIDNDIGLVGRVIQVIVKENITSSDTITLIAKNNIHEFARVLDLNPLIVSDTGYYQNVSFENKFWLTNGSNWQFILKLNNNTLVEKILELDIVYSLLYKDLDETPFITNNQKKVNLYDNYTFRSRKDDTDIIIIYFCPDWQIYTPIIYLIPEDIQNEYIDVGISWVNENAKGIYFIRNYKFDELPTEELTMPVFDWIEVR